MKALLALTLVSLFLTQAHAVEDIELKVVSKECKGESVPVDPYEKVKFTNGMLAKFSPSVSDDSKSCKKVEVSFVTSTIITTIKNIHEEQGMLLHPTKREVCRDPKTSAVLSDVQSDLENSGMSMKVSINTKKKTGSLIIVNSSECPEGEMKLELAE